jgi:HEAT repeat protein
MRIASGILFASFVMTSAPAFAGHGSSALAIQSAVQSNSVDAIVAELEKSEELPSRGAIDVVMPLIDHASPRVRDAVGWWLTRRGVRSLVITNMTARLTTGSDPVAARNAADVLAGMRDYTTLPALGAYLKAPLDEDSGISAAKAIGAIGHPTGLALLNAGLGSSLAGVKAQAAASLRDLRAPKGAKVAAQTAVLLPLLSDADANVRRQTIMTIGFVGQSGGDVTGAVAALSPLATGDASAVVRKAAAWALGELKDGAARGALQAAANDADPLVRSIASAALANLR